MFEISNLRSEIFSVFLISDLRSFFRSSECAITARDRERVSTACGSVIAILNQSVPPAVAGGSNVQVSTSLD